MISFMLHPFETCFPKNGEDNKPFKRVSSLWAKEIPQKLFEGLKSRGGRQEVPPFICYTRQPIS